MELRGGKMPELNIPQLPLKEWKVTLWPKPVTVKVLAQTAMQARSMAEFDYTSKFPNSFSTYRADIEELGIFSEV